MTYRTLTQQAVEKQVQSVASEELTTIEISFYDHEIFAGQKLIAQISYDHADFVTQPWVVMINGEEVHRANTWAKCHSFITWHYTQGTLLVQEQQEALTTSGNETVAQIAAECEKFEFDLMDDGIYHGDIKLGEVGCTDNRWWFVRASEEHEGRIPRDSALDAVWSLSMVETDVKTLSCENLLDKPFEMLTAGEWRRLLKYQPVSAERELVPMIAA
jgi:hypothetical protein